MENNFVIVFWKASWHQLLDSEIKSRMFRLKKSIWPWSDLDGTT